MRYTEDDIQIFDKRDHMGFVRSHPKMFLPHENVSCGFFLGMMTDQVVSITETPILACRFQDWWCLAATTDWIPETHLKDLPNYFQSMIACPEWAINTVRFEIVMNVFLDDVFTFTQKETMLIKGELPAAEVIAEARKCSSDWQRILLFRKSNP